MAKPGEKKDSKHKPKNWYADRYEFVVVQRNLLALISVISLVASAAAVFAVAQLSSSKSFEPYVIQVEKKTGITTSVNRNAIEKYTAEETVKRYFLVKYLQAREGYDPADFQYNFTKVIRLMSNGPVFNQYRTGVLPDNPESPLNLPRNFKRVVRIKSLSFIDVEKKKAQVRILVDTTNEAGSPIPERKKNLIVIVDFDFADLQLGEEDRYVNPLGFQVKGYRVDNDVE